MNKMELDFVSEVDKKFYSDNFLLSDDWDNPDQCVVDQLFADGSITADDFMTDLGIPMLDGEDMLMDTMGSGLLQDSSDSSDSGLDCGSLVVKDEPLSPVSSPSSDTQLEGTTIQLLDLCNPPSFAGLLPADIKLESPPLTPERDVIEVDKPFPISQPTNRLNFDITAINPQPAVQKLPSGSKIITGNNGIRIIQAPLVSNKTVTPIIHNRVKIQPRPPALLQPRTPLTTKPGASKPLVLTAEEFAKLTQQGVLKFQHPAERSSPSLSPPPPPTSVPHQTKSHRNGDVKLVKRQQRMIKNRESACLSRKRKKEYVSNVEKQLHDYSDENLRLKEQNDQLRKRILMLQTENDHLKSSFGGSIKKATVVMAVLFLLSLNLSSLTGLLNTNRDMQNLVDPQSGSGIYHRSRTLLGVNVTEASDQTNTQQNKATYRQATSLHTISAALEGLRQLQGSPPLGRDVILMKRLEEINIPVSMCPSYFNSSESERLMNELTGWVLGHKAGMKAAADAEKGHEDTTQPPSSNKKRPRKKYAAPRKLKAAFKTGGIRKTDRNGSNGQYEVQVFTERERNYQDFMHAIHRRNDTFYVVSFRRDHLLLPATAHNQTSRPRMSLLMPVISTNETLKMPEGSITMMQIDCEVTATRLLHVHKSSVPQDLSHDAHTNHTTMHTDRQNRPRKWPQKTKWRQTP